MVRTLFAAIIAALFIAVSIPGVGAHPLGNFSVNRYSRIEVGRDAVQLRYVLDLAEIPTLQELQGMGIQGGRPGGDALRRLQDAKVAQISEGAQLTINGQLVTWTVLSRSIELVPGQAELDTMRVELTLSAPLAAAEGAQLAYRDVSYPGRIGWHEVVLRGAGQVSLAQSTVPARDQTDELRQYPADPSRAPLDVSAAAATLTLTAAIASEEASTPAGASTPRLALDPTASVLAGFLREGPGSNPVAIVLALLVAAGLGALHALEPGHGKTLVGGYLVGSRGTPRHALLLGLTVTATHTLGVYLLGLVTLVAAQYVLPERLYPVLGMLSGLLLVAVGISLARARLREAFPNGERGRRKPRIQVIVHHHGQGHGHVHAHGEQPHHHEHGHQHKHEAAMLSHHRPESIPHSHGSRVHTHEVPGADGVPITMRSLLALGVSGGLLPCPSALVVLLAAVSFQNVGLGLALVAAFSAGLAAVLTGLGLAIVYGGRLVTRTPWAGRAAQWPLVRAVPALSAIAITVAGLAIAAQAARAFA